MELAQIVQMTSTESLKTAETASSNEVISTTQDYFDYYYYTYNYSFDENLLYLPMEEVVPVSLLYGFIGLSGLVGNLLVIFAILRVQRMRSITNLFLLSLASADLLLVVICVPVKGIAFYSYTWRLGEFMCRLVSYVQTVSMVCSALTLTAMSIERFVAIRHPLKARSVCTIRHARIVILSVWTMSILLAIPSAFAISFREVGPKDRPAYWCHKHWLDKPSFGKAYELYMLLVILIIPVVVMVTTYTWIANIIWNVASRRADMRAGRVINTSKVKGETQINTQTRMIPIKPTGIQVNGAMVIKPQAKAYMDDDSTRKQIVLMLMVVVILFAFCWTPILVNNVLVAFEHLDYLNTGYLKVLRMVFHILSYANSCVNPFVYAFMSKNFRDGFRQSLCSCLIGEQYLRRKMTSLRSMTSTTRVSASQAGEKMNVIRLDSVRRLS